MALNAIKKSIELANSGRKVPALSLVDKDPELAALVSKLVAPPVPPTYGRSGNITPTAPQINSFKNVSQHTAQSIGDAETVMQLLPDMDLARQILVSSILSPKDMTVPELTYKAPEGLMAPNILAAMLARSKQHFEQDYKIKPLLGTMLSDMLFNTGSYAVAVIPENSLDELINSPRNVSMESIGLQLAEHVNLATGSMKSLGLLGAPIQQQPTLGKAHPTLSMESFSSYQPAADVDGKVTFEGILDKPVDDSYLFVSDNIHLLKIPEINQKIRENRIMDIYGVNKGRAALEAKFEKLTDREMVNLMYKSTQYGHNPITSLKTQEQLKRRTVGNPLILHLPSESVIPVFIPGTPEQQIGFFVLVDADGNPVSRTNNTNYYQELTARLNSNGNFPSAMLTKTRSMMGGFPSVNAHETDYSVRAYQEIVEADLMARLRNGFYGNGVALGRREEIYRIMLSRTLAKQYTQLLFIPIEFMTYFAFKYTPDGIGESLLDTMRVLNSMRAMLMFANVMAGVKNSIGRTAVELELDPEDPDPKKTIELAAHEIVRSRQQYFPLGMNSPTDLVDWLQRSGFEFAFSGHPAVPQVKIQFNEKNSSYVKPDTELTEGLDKRAIMATGLSPDNIDAAFHAEFATSIVQNNILLSKRVMQYQDAFTPLLADHARKVIMTSEHLREDLRKILRDNYEELKPEEEDVNASNAQKRDVIQQQNDASHSELSTAIKKDVAFKDSSGDGSGTTPEATETPTETPEETPAPSTGIPYGVTESGKIQLNSKKEQKVESTSGEDDAQKEFLIDQILTQFIRGFEIYLPRPNAASLENQMTSMESYGKALDEGLDAWLSEKFFTTEVVGEVATNVVALRESIKAYYMRKFMSENGILPELSELTTADESGQPVINIYDMQKSHIESLVTSLTESLVKLTVVRNDANTVLDKTGAVAAGAGDTGDGATDDGMGGGDTGLGGFDAGGDTGTDDTDTDTTPAPDDTGNAPAPDEGTEP
jgi:hypothetical protein